MGRLKIDMGCDMSVEMGTPSQHDLSHKLAGRRRVDTMTDSNLVR